MLIQRYVLLCFLLLMCSLSFAHAQVNDDELELITSSNLGRLVKLRDLARVSNFPFGRMSFNANDTLLAGALGSGVRIWSLATGNAADLIEVEDCDCYREFTFHSTNPEQIATCNKMWDANTLQIIFEGEFCNGIAFDPTGEFLFTGNSLELLDAETGATIRRLLDSTELSEENTVSNVCSASFSPDGTKLAFTATIAPTGENMLVIDILDLESGTLHGYIGTGDAAWMGSCMPFDRLVFSSDGRYLYSNAPANLLRFDTENPTAPENVLPEVTDVQGNIERFLIGENFAFTPDEQLLFYTFFRESNSGSALYMAAFDMDTREEVLLPEEIRDARAVISHDGKLLVAYSRTQITLWGVPSGE